MNTGQQIKILKSAIEEIKGELERVVALGQALQDRVKALEEAKVEK